MEKITELVIIIDKSGSMHGLEKDVIGGFNSLIEQQKKEGNTKVTTVFFNDNVQVVNEGIDVNEISLLTEKDYNPRGCTALLDAIGNSISLIKSKHAKLTSEELPETVIFSIMTDGMENSSKEFSYSKIKEMIELQKKCGWDFIFQAANIDTEYEADRLGIDRKYAKSFKADVDGIKYCMASIAGDIDDIKSKRRKK